jgi:hypothetical protein
MPDPKTAVLKTLVAALGVLDFLLLTAAILVAAPPLVMRFFPPKSGETYVLLEPLTRFVQGAQAPLALVINSRVPHEFGGVDVTPYLLCAIFLALSFGCTLLLRRVRAGLPIIDR